MITVSAKYPVFVVPVLRMKNDPEGEVEAERAHEFYFLQWGFHGAPPAPSGVDDPFCTSNAVSSSPQISTILFTPLQEYKMRAAFATPYLVLTFYTDLVTSHGIVLMRGEITPSTASTVAGAAESEGRHLLNQEDAQLLAMQVQKFYLWGEANNEEKGREGERLLKEFHEKPQEFKWEELLKHGDLSV
jgi:ATP synthase F1 complex assembly factor 1